MKNVCVPASLIKVVSCRTVRLSFFLFFFNNSCHSRQVSVFIDKFLSAGKCIHVFNKFVSIKSVSFGFEQVFAGSRKVLVSANSFQL